MFLVIETGNTRKAFGMVFRRLDRLVAEVMAQLENDMRVAREIGAAPAEWGTPEPLAQSGEEDARSGMGKNGRTTAPKVEREVIKPGEATRSFAYAQRMLSAVPVGTRHARMAQAAQGVPRSQAVRASLVLIEGGRHADTMAGP